jgi:hypothetical protein
MIPKNVSQSFTLKVTMSQGVPLRVTSVLVSRTTGVFPRSRSPFTALYAATLANLPNKRKRKVQKISRPGVGRDITVGNAPTVVAKVARVYRTTRTHVRVPVSREGREKKESPGAGQERLCLFQHRDEGKVSFGTT